MMMQSEEQQDDPQKLIESLKDVPASAGYPHEQRMAFYHGVASILQILGMPEKAQEFGALRDQGMTTGSAQSEMPYEEPDFIG